MRTRLSVVSLLSFLCFIALAQNNTNQEREEKGAEIKLSISSPDGQLGKSLKNYLIEPTDKINQSNLTTIEFETSHENIGLVIDRCYNLCLSKNCEAEQLITVLGYGMSGEEIIPTYYFNESPFLEVDDETIVVRKANDNDIVCMFSEAVSKITILNGRSTAASEFYPYVKLGSIIKLPAQSNVLDRQKYCELTMCRIYLDNSLSMTTQDRENAVESAKQLISATTLKSGCQVEILTFGDEEELLYTGPASSLNNSDQLDQLFSLFIEKSQPSLLTNWTAAKADLSANTSLSVIITDGPFNSNNNEFSSTVSALQLIAKEKNQLRIDVNSTQRVFGALIHSELSEHINEWIDEDCVDAESNTNSQTSIYPNPAANILNISYDQKNVQVFKISSLDGKECLIQSASKQVDVSDLENGAYYIELLDNENQQIERHRFIKF